LHCVVVLRCFRHLSPNNEAIMKETGKI